MALAGRSRRPVLAGEAKWAGSLDATRHLEVLRRKASRLPGADDDDLRYALCARDRVAAAPPGVLAVIAADIMAADAAS